MIPRHDAVEFGVHPRVIVLMTALMPVLMPVLMPPPVAVYA